MIGVTFHLSQNFKKKINCSTNFKENAVLLNTWEDFGGFLRKKLNLLNSHNEKLVASSNGLPRPIKRQLVDAYKQQGIEILGINECPPVNFDNSKSLEYLRGNVPTWEIFSYNDEVSCMPEDCINPLVKRDLTEEILKQVGLTLKMYIIQLQVLTIPRKVGTI